MFVVRLLLLFFQCLSVLFCSVQFLSSHFLVHTSDKLSSFHIHSSLPCHMSFFDSCVPLFFVLSTSWRKLSFFLTSMARKGETSWLFTLSSLAMRCNRNQGGMVRQGGWEKDISSMVRGFTEDEEKWATDADEITWRRIPLDFPCSSDCIDCIRDRLFSFCLSVTPLDSQSSLRNDGESWYFHERRRRSFMAQAKDISLTFHIAQILRICNCPWSWRWRCLSLFLCGRLSTVSFEKCS